MKKEHNIQQYLKNVDKRTRQLRQREEIQEQGRDKYIE